MKINPLKSAKWALALASAGLFICAVPAPKFVKNTGNKSSIRKVKTDLSAVRLNNVEFAFAQINVRPDAYGQLNKVARLMSENNAAVQISGHTDNVGGYVYNWKLSEARALAVKKYLAAKGADTARIAATEYGFTKPLASNKTPVGRQKNRRVEIRFVQ